MTAFTFEKINPLRPPMGLPAGLPAESRPEPQNGRRFPASASAGPARTVTGRGFWHRVLDALCEARLEAARREIRRLHIDGGRMDEGRRA